ncbi:hypothetical protein [Caenibius sp. WL]|nr:hypothetical protein [Caenibius sp. WL]QZP07168.1 hypothetical protein K5X80_10695 [Caenibius sp. WL]
MNNSSRRNDRPLRPMMCCGAGMVALTAISQTLIRHKLQQEQYFTPHPGI